VPILALGEGQQFATRKFVLNKKHQTTSEDVAADADYVEVPADL
jgi:hypothetical protein